MSAVKKYPSLTQEDLAPIAKKFAEVQKTLGQGIFERTDEITGLCVAIVSGKNILLLGPPGAAKSYLINAFSGFVGGTDTKVFNWLLGKYSTPDELFGPPSLEGLKKDKFIRQTKNKLPESNFAFIDEIFKGNTGILNTLLSIMNERTFFNDGVEEHVPLLTLVGASNEVPDAGDGLDAMYDRFHLKFQVKSLQEKRNRMKMLKSGGIAPNPIFTLDELFKLQAWCKEVVLTDKALEDMLKIHDALAKNKIGVTDRTLKAAVSLVQANALINGKIVADTGDLEILQHAFWKEPENYKKVANIILEIANPLAQKIQEYFDDARGVYASLDNLKPGDDISAKGLEATSKLRDIKSNLEKEASMLVKAGATKSKEVADIKAKIAEVDTWLATTFDKLFNSPATIKK